MELSKIIGDVKKDSETLRTANAQNVSLPINGQISIQKMQHSASTFYTLSGKNSTFNIRYPGVPRETEEKHLREFLKNEGLEKKYIDSFTKTVYSDGIINEKRLNELISKTLETRLKEISLENLAKEIKENLPQLSTKISEKELIQFCKKYQKSIREGDNNQAETYLRSFSLVIVAVDKSRRAFKDKVGENQYDKYVQLCKEEKYDEANKLADEWHRKGLINDEERKLLNKLTLMIFAFNNGKYGEVISLGNEISKSLDLLDRTQQQIESTNKDRLGVVPIKEQETKEYHEEKEESSKKEEPSTKKTGKEELKKEEKKKKELEKKAREENEKIQENARRGSGERPS